MYTSFYGLKHKPFGLHPDPDYLYMSEMHEQAYSHLIYAITENKGFAVVTGEIGSGKTTLVNYLLGKIGQKVHAGLINRTDVPPDQLLKMICQEFELPVKGMDKADMQDRLDEFLVQEFAAKKRVVLIIDEAQNLPKKSLEEIRMLSNLETEKECLIQIIMLGQPELRAKLQEKGLEQFAQRVTVHCHLGGLSEEETAIYIRHRLQIAGAKEVDIFDREAMDRIHSHSRGIPRLINILCDTALVYGYADEKRVIDRDIIDNVIKDRKDITTNPDLTARKGSDDASGSATGVSEFLENKLGLIGERLTALEQQINRLEDMRSRRDVIVLELLKGIVQELAHLQVTLENREGEEDHERPPGKVANLKSNK